MKYAKSIVDGNVTSLNGIPFYLIRNELITERECKKLGLDFNGIYFKPIEIPKSRVFWSFGARFEIREE